MAEQVDRESTESVLQQDLKDAKDEIGKRSVGITFLLRAPTKLYETVI